MSTARGPGGWLDIGAVRLHRTAPSGVGVHGKPIGQRVGPRAVRRSGAALGFTSTRSAITAVPQPR